jgi:hypothetical protein
MWGSGSETVTFFSVPFDAKDKMPLASKEVDQDCLKTMPHATLYYLYVFFIFYAFIYFPCMPNKLCVCVCVCVLFYIFSMFYFYNRMSNIITLAGVLGP